MTQDNIYLLTNHNISPAAMAGALGMRCVRDNGKLQTQCPACHGSMTLTSSGFLCAGTSCTFWTGDPLDLAAIVLGSYEEALDLANTLSPNWLATKTSRNWESSRLHLADTLRDIRKVLQFFIDLPKQQQNLARVQAQVMCAKHVVNPEAMPRSVFAITGSDAKRLYSLSLRFASQKETPSDIGYAALVFFKDPHRICKVLLLPLINGRRQMGFLTLRFFSGRFSFFGIHDLREGDKPVLCQQFLAAARDNGHNFSTRRRNFKLGLSLDAAVQQERSVGGYWPQAASIFIDAESEPIISAISVAQSTGDLPVVVKFNGREYPAQSWDKFTREWILERLRNKEGDPLQWLAWLDSACLPQEARAHALAFAIQHLDKTLVMRMREIFHHRAVLHDDRLTLLETPEGYHVQRSSTGNDMHRIELANFTIELKHTLIFSDAAENIFFSGNMQCSGKVYSVQLSREATNNIQTLETALQSAAIRGTAPGDACPVPIVRDRSLGRLILTWLRNQAAVLPTVHGVTRLGWDSQRVRFQAPTWLLTAEGTFRVPAVLHPEMLPKIYGAEPGECPAPELVPPDLCSLCARLVATIARAGLGEPQRPIFYSDTLSTRAALNAVFSALGQVLPLDLSFGTDNMRFLDSLRGYPVLISGLNAAQVSRHQLSFFLLGAGQDIRSEVPDGLAFFMRSAIEKTVHWVLSGAAGYKRASGVLHEEQLEREGEMIFKQILGLSGWPGSTCSFPRFEAWLRETSLTSIEETCTLDAQTQLVSFPITDRDVEMELRARANHVERREGLLLVDAATAMVWLQNFYSAAPRLRLTNLPTIPEAPH